jgi:IS1 family transposase
MDTLATGIIISYTSTYLIRFAINCFTNALFNRTTGVVKNKAKQAWNHITYKEIKKDIIEYELIDLDKEDERTYVTSKRKVSEDWSNINTSTDSLQTLLEPNNLQKLEEESPIVKKVSTISENSENSEKEKVD